MKILTLDIETAPNLADVWSLWNVNVSLSQLRRASYTLCWAAKWHHETEVRFGAGWQDGLFMAPLFTLVNEADVIVTYNGDRFDLPTINRDFHKLELGPPAPYRSVDLYKQVKKHFKLASNKLSYVTEYFGVGEKMKHSGQELWSAVMNDDREAQLLMEQYCKQDVVITEGLHDDILPWITSYPNGNLYAFSMQESCGKCAASLTKRGFAYTPTGKYQRYQCRGCRSWSRGNKRIEGIEIVGL